MRPSLHNIQYWAQPYLALREVARFGGEVRQYTPRRALRVLSSSVRQSHTSTVFDSMQIGGSASVEV